RAPLTAVPASTWRPSRTTPSRAERGGRVNEHKLIGAEVSYYTGKVRAYLRYKAIAFEEISASAEVYRDAIIPRTGVRFPSAAMPSGSATPRVNDRSFRSTCGAGSEPT